MTSPNENTKEDLLKQFDLPERQTKINTILKMQRDAPLYCICQTADIEKFMIMCEKCEEWFHGDCIGMRQKDSKIIKKWFCLTCIKNHGLKIVYKSASNIVKKKKQEKHQVFYEKDPEYQHYDSGRCGLCSNCLQNKECGNSNFKLRLKRRKIASKDQKAENVENINPHSRNNELFKSSEHKKINHGRNALRELNRCFGPSCYKLSREGSKYCSEECGLALAKLRLVAILPKRIAERDVLPCEADTLDRTKLESNRQQQKITAEKLKMIEIKETELRKLIERAKKVPILETDCHQGFHGDSKIYCIICGWDIPLPSAGRHMELCYKKMEMQYEVVGKSQTTSSRIFCDFYDESKKTYCKRLRSICPDHVKPQKVSQNEVCGCPIVSFVSSNTFLSSDVFCQKSKRKCDDHCNWENTALAEIDLEHLKEINKMKLLVEEEGIILQRLTNRLSALGILLHSTSAS